MSDIEDGITALEERLTGPYADIASLMAMLRELRDRREADRWIPIAEATPITHRTYWVAYSYDYDSTIHRELAVWCGGGFRSIDTNRDWDYSRVTHVIPLRIPSPPESEPTK